MGTKRIWFSLPQSLGDAHTKFVENVSFFRGLGHGAAKLEMREELCRLNEDQLDPSSACKRF